LVRLGKAKYNGINMRNTLHLFLLLVAFVASSTRLSAQPENDVTLDCGYRLELTAIGTEMMGRLVPKNGQAASLVTVAWKDVETGTLLENGANLNFNMGDFGTYKIRAEFQTITATGNLGCSTYLEREIELIDDHCVQSFSMVANTECGSEFAPVCGCNGVSYINECEAKKAGVTKFWAGSCATQPSASNCGTTDFEFEVITGSLTTGYTVIFKNLAQGGFTNLQLDFGDHTTLLQGAQWSTHEHHYETGGIFSATLTAWDINQPGCISSVSKTFATDALSLEIMPLPAITDYVMPGDGNGDGRANAYDLINVGLGYFTFGAPRPDATTEWTEQYCPNWQLCTNTMVNYKHMDSNGDGIINELDILPIEAHYQPITPFPYPEINEDAPEIFVRFDKDTIVVDPANPGLLEISADIIVGTPENPVFDLYGMACAMRYPEFVEKDPTLLYDPTFFGSSNLVLSLGHDVHSQFQYDFGVTNKSGTGASGYGRVAKLSMRADYIIIIDIIDRAAAETVPFVMPLEGLRAIDAEGNEKLLKPTVVDTLWIKVLPTPSKTTDLFEQGKVRVFPNPATDQINIATNQIALERVEIINAQGQLVRTLDGTALASNTVMVSDLAKGLYTMRVIADEGVGEQKVMVR
jgi:hypothetical protein